MTTPDSIVINKALTPTLHRWIEYGVLEIDTLLKANDVKIKAWKESKDLDYTKELNEISIVQGFLKRERHQLLLIHNAVKHLA